MKNKYLLKYIIAIILLTTWAFTADGQTNCPPVGLPLTENFDTPDSLPYCWSRDENFDNEAMKAHVVGSPVYAGSGALMISSGADNDTVHEAFVMGRRLATSPTGIRMKMKVRANQAGAVLMVGACEATSYFVMEYGFSAVDTLTITAANVWIDYEVDYSGYTGSGDRLAFRMRQAMQGGQIGNEIYIDEITVERCAVENLWVSHRSSDELTLHWTSVGDGSADLTVTATGASSGTTYTAVESPYRITGLTPSTTYTLTLTPQCTGENADGLPKSIPGTTLAGPHEGLVYCESFEAGSCDAGWTFAGSANASSVRSYTGLRGLYLPETTGYGAMPQIAHSSGALADIDSLMVEMKIYAIGSATRIAIGITDYPEEYSTIVAVDTLTPAIANAWSNHMVRLARHSAAGRYVTLRAIGGSVYIDDLRVGRCLITGVALAGRTANSITLEWDAPDAGVGVAIEPITGGGSTIHVDASQCVVADGKWRYTIDGLQPGSSHSYSVYGTCDDGHCGAATVAATTYAQDYAVPYCTDFENSGTLPTDWQNCATHNGRPQTGNGNRHSGSRALEMSAGGGTASQHSLTMLPPIAFGNATTVVVSFAAMSQYTGGTLEVGTIDESGQESSFTVGASCSPTQQWTRYALTVAVGGGDRLALRYYHNGSTSRTAWVDDLEVNHVGAGNIYATGIRATGATLMWTATGDTIDIEVRQSGSIWTTRYNAAVSPLTIDSLDEGVTYNYYVRGRNGATGCWMYGGSFTTNSDAMHADYCHPYTFSLGTTLWSLPYLEEDSYTGLRVSLEAIGSGSVQIGLMTDAGDATTFTQIGSGQLTAADWSRIVVALGGHENAGHYIALRCTGNAQVRHLRIARGDITGHAESGIGATQATLSWTADGNVDSVEVLLSQGSAAALDTVVPYPAVTSLTLDGLDAGTYYSYSLTPISAASGRSCGNSDGTFVTLGADIADGWCETFDGTGYGTLPVGWTAVNGNGNDPAVYYNSGSTRLRMTSGPTTTATVALPEALVPMNTLVLRAAVTASGTPATGAMLIAGIMTSPTAANSFVPVDTAYLGAASRVCAFDLRRYSGTGRCVALRLISPGGNTTVYLDNMGLATEQISDLRADRITDRSVRLRWQSSEHVHITGSGVDTIIHGAHETVVGGLAADGSYTFTAYVVGSDSTSVCCTTSVAVHTLTEPMSVPLCLNLDDYNSATALPYGWTRPYGSSPVSSTGTRYEGTRSLQFSTGNGSTMAVSPMVEDGGAEGYYLSFYYYSNGGTMEVGTMSDPDDSTTFTAIASYSATTGWSRCEVHVVPPAGSPYHLAFRHTVTTSWTQTAYIDYIMLLACPMPTATIQNPRTNTLEVHWNYPAGGGDSVVIQYGTTSVVTGLSPYIIEGLASSTDYTVRVRPYCGGDLGCHSILLAQRTLDEPADMPYCQNFNGYNMPTDWHVWSDNGSVNLNTNTPDGSRGLRMYAYAGHNVTAIMPQINTGEYCSDLDSVYIIFRLASSGGVRAGTQLQIGTVSDLLDNSSFTMARTVPLNEVNDNEWRNYILNIPASSLVTGFLAFRLVAPGNESASVTIDEICVRYCYASDIRMVDMTPTTATFTWRSFGANSITVHWSGGSYTATSSPFTITGLSPNQTYSFAFDADCPCNHHHGSGSVRRRIEAEPMVMPVCYGFSDLSDGSFPFNWRRSGGSYTAYPRVWAAGGESQAMDLYTTPSDTLTMAMEPLPDERNSVVVSLRAWCSDPDGANSGRLEVGTMLDPENRYTFTPLQSLTLSATETWETFHVVVPQPSRRYVAFRFTPAATYHYYLDDISVAACAVGELATGDNTVGIATLGTASGVLVEVERADGEAVRTVGPLTAGAYSFAALGLAADTAYTLHAYALCTDTIGCPDESIAIGIRHALPLCEDFSGDDLQPYGWEVIGRNGPVYPRIDSGAYHMQPTPGHPDCVQLPLLPVGVTAGGLNVRLTLTFNGSTNRNYAYLEIGTVAGGVFTPLAELHNTAATQTHYVVLPASVGTRLALRARSTSGQRDLYVDDLQITVYPEPSAYTLTQTGYRQQHIRWNADDGAARYGIEYGPNGFAAGEGDTVFADSCHAVMAPLTGATSYQFRFIDTAGIPFCYMHEFTSMPTAVDMPWCTGDISLGNGQQYIMPESSEQVQALTMLLNWQGTQGSSLVVGAMSDIADNATFTPVDTLYPRAASTWQRDSVVLAAYADTGHFVAVRAANGNISIAQLTLQTVQQPHFHVLSSSTIEVSLPGDDIDCYLRVCAPGQQQDAGTLHHVTASPYVITGLSMYTWYNIYTLPDATSTTCAPPVALRTHLDIDLPHCTDLGGTLPAGWLAMGRYRMMPWPLVDSLARMHLYLGGIGSVTIGATAALDDTASFVALTTVSLGAADSHIYLAPYADAIGSRHYLAFRLEGSGSALGALNVQTVARPTFHVLSSSAIEATLPDGLDADYYIEACLHGQPQGTGTVYHATTSPYIVGGLDMFTWYDLYVRADSASATCAAPVTLRTHLDIAPPYCNLEGSDGWYTAGTFHVMPRAVVDTMISLYATFRSQGSLTLGVQMVLTDTTTFVPLVDIQSSTFEEHLVYLADYAALVGDRHYLSFRYTGSNTAVEQVYLHTCPVPRATLFAFDVVRFDQDSAADYWIAYADTVIHVDTTPYYLRGLEQNTIYQFSIRCDSAIASCIPPIEIRTGVQIEAPHCANLNGHRFTIDNLPDGWFTLGGGEYVVMPIINVDSVAHVYMRLRYRLSQIGTAMAVGVMTNPYDAATFTTLTTLSDVGPTYNTIDFSFGDYADTGLYIAFHAIGNNPQSAIIDNIELQTVPFVHYLLTASDSVLVTPTLGTCYGGICYIGYADTLVAADSLPWGIGGLPADSELLFNIQANDSTPPCIAPTPVATTHPAATPLCDLDALLTAAEPLWRGPELTDADIASLLLRANATNVTGNTRIAVGTMVLRNVDSTFRGVDTIILSSAGSVTASMARYAGHGRFLALRLLDGGATLNGISLDHCLTPVGATLALQRHNVVRLYEGDMPGNGALWLHYGPTGGAQTTVLLDSLPRDFTLANGSEYTFVLACDSVAADGSTASCATPLTIVTLAPPPPLSWCEPFDATNATLPADWRMATPQNTAQTTAITSARSHTQQHSLSMHSTIGHNSVVVLPDLGLDSLNDLSLSLWLNTDNTTLGVLEVGVIFNTSDPETFRPLRRLTCRQANTWERHVVDMADAPEGAYFLALRCRGVSGTDNVWIDDLHVAECGANSLEVTNVEANQITLRWRQTGTPALSLTVLPNGEAPYSVPLDGLVRTYADEPAYRYATIAGLTALTNYRFAFSAVCGGSGYCTNDYADTCSVFTPAGGSGCIDPTNLTASYSTCFYGTYGDPVADTGSIDYGYASALSRHTVHYDLNETDPRTGGMLHTVPEGAPASVRLGNWSHNSATPEAEAISYGINVDTMEFNLLIMRYAAVLQDPNHSRDKQPRFSLELLDATGHVLDSSCGRADFIANYMLGWNVAANNVLWKDWTTVGIDLTPYAGQTVYVRLTTRDCNEGSHYGYAYFTLECMRRNVTTASCGITDNNQFTAPSGFNYYWYTSASADTISTAQSISVPTDNTLNYLCQVSFVDNPGCYFTMSAYAGTRYPLSLFDYEVSLAPCSFDVVFTNRSTISSDGINPVGTGEGVETAVWILGNGDTVAGYNTSANYEAGTYNVSLVTGIAGDACLDTLTVPLNLVLPPTGMEISGATQRCWNAAADTLWLPNVVQMLQSSHTWTLDDSTVVGTQVQKRYYLVVDSASYAVGSYNFTVSALDSVGCTVALSHPMTVHPTYRIYDTLHLCSLLLPYAWRDTTMTAADLTPPSSTTDHCIHRYTAEGCDSVMHLNLTLYNNADFTPRDTAYGAICDNQSFYFSDSLLVPDAAATHNIGIGSLTYTDSLFSSIGCDSLSTIVLTVHPTYDHHLGDTVCSNRLYTWGTPQRQVLPADSTVAHLHGSDTLAAVASVYPADTSFTDNLYSIGGCDSLSSLHLHLLPAYALHFYDTICDAHITGFGSDSLAEWQLHAYRFEHTDYDSTGVYQHLLAASHGPTGAAACDSLRTLHLKVYPTYDLHHYDTIYDGDRYTFEQSTYDTTGVYPHLLATTAWPQAVAGCDSLRTLHLQRNRRTYIDTVVCQNSLPYTWNMVTFGDGGGDANGRGMQVLRDSVHLSGLDGIDSLVVMTVVVRDTSATTDIVHSCDSLVWFHTPDTTYRTSTDAPYRRLLQHAAFDTNGLGNYQRGGNYEPYTVHLAPFAVSCDSVRHLQLSIDYTHYTTDYRIACDSLTWPDAAGALTTPRRYYRDTLGHYGRLGSYSVSGPVDTMVTVGGCDSVVNLDLNVHYATYECEIDTFCWNEYYFWRTQFAGDTSAAHWRTTDHYYLSETLQTHRFHHRVEPTVSITCDSVRAIQLTQMARPLLQLTDSIDCGRQLYMFGIETDVAYTRWSDNRTTQVTTQPAIEVAPATVTTYRAYVDYHAAPLCPLRDSLTVRPVVVPEAVMKVNPEELRYNALEFDAYDISTVAPRSIHPDDAEIWVRGWYIDGLLQDETDWHLHRLATPDRDTLQLALRVFNGQCADTTLRLLPIERVALFAPNVFTPLRDNNQRFFIVGHGIVSAELYIYNREGLLLYSTETTAPDGNIEIGWDGRRSDGTLCEQGNYVWKLIYQTIDKLNAKQDEVGNVLLLR